MSEVLLTIQIMSVAKRVSTFLPRIIEQLDEQCGDDERVEILCLLDNQRVSLGMKSNHLTRIARGRFVTCVDDDDMVSDDYVSELLAAIESHPDVDCICFNTDMYVDGKFLADVYWGLEVPFRDDFKDKKLFRPPGHLMAITRELRLKNPYPDRWRGSDWRMAKQLQTQLRTGHKIEKILYHYYNRSGNTDHIDKQAEVDRKKKVERAMQRIAVGVVQEAHDGMAQG